MSCIFQRNEIIKQLELLESLKVNIYEFIVKQCFANYKIKKDYTSGFPNTKIGYYLIKD